MRARRRWRPHFSRRSEDPAGGGSDRAALLGTGALLWKAAVGGQVGVAPIAYQVNGTQHISIAAGNVLFTYALRD